MALCGTPEKCGDAKLPLTIWFLSLHLRRLYTL
jgi:hypothetical protein